MHFLIVDDNISLVEGLQNLALWEKYNCTATGVTSAVEALQIILSRKVDVVITDIKMPQMSGLDLCRTLQIDFPWIERVVISAYTDFSYAQQAIQYGVSTFLMKPIDLDELEQVVTQLLKKKEQLDENKSSTLYRHIFSTDPLEQVYTQKLIDSQFAQFFLAISLQPLQSVSTGLTCWDGTHHIYCLPTLQELDCCTEGLLYDPMPTHAQDVRNRYETLCTQSNRLFLHKNQKLVTYHTPQKANWNSILSVLDIIKSNTEINHLSTCTSTAIRTFYQQLKQQIPTLTKEQTLDILQHHILFATQYQLAQGTDVSQSYDAQQEHLKSLCYYDDLIESFIAYFELQKELIHQNKQSTDERFIQMIERYIQQNLEKPLTIQLLSDQFERSTSYISKKFNSVRNTTFPDYLNALRLEQAKYRLSYTDDTVEKIAKEIGYQSTRHFLRTFKKTENITPTEYRMIYWNKNKKS